MEPMFPDMDGAVEPFRRQVLAGKISPTRVGPYLLLEHLGRGGMGHVYKAQHRLMKRVVALKLVGRFRRGRDNAAVLNRFRREVEAAARVRHPSIVTAYDAGISRGRLYLAMEYVEGSDLERLVENSGPLSVDLACEIVRQAAEALHHAHERGLVHRDIKPSNLMLAPPGVTVKVLDLGLAQLNGSPASRLDADEAEQGLSGTPDFMAPEWGHSPRSADVRGDLYSLGCTFYFLLTGQVPFPGGSWIEKLLRHRLDVPAPLRHLRPDAPAAVAAIVERLMAREVENRFTSASAVATEIGKLTLAPLTVPKETNGDNAKPTLSGSRSSRGAARLSCTAMIAILLGVAAAGGARWMVAPRPMSPKTQPKTSAFPFTIEGCSNGFPSLAEAIDAAKEGDIVTIHGPGPFVIPPINWEGKALTLRAASGSRPLLEMKTGDNPWQALLQTNRALTLERLDLAVAADATRRQQAPAAPLIRCIQAPLYLTSCNLTNGGDGAVIVARGSNEVVIRGCGIDAGMVGLSLEASQGRATRLRMVDTRLNVRHASGAALSLWAAEPQQRNPVELRLEGNTIQADCITTVRVLPSTFSVLAVGNRFRYRTALLSYSGCTERDAWRGANWQGNGNSYQGPPCWLWIEGKPIASAEQPPIR
ncbi:MAG TPA: serine/threonine-protein kinase [Gemmataceae bacterium]|nr:serine/threonine-protein kinase [Gemmataceae bacterium]